MATTENNYTGDGTTTTYSFTFPYLNATDVKVSKDGTLLDRGSESDEYTQATTSITLNTAPESGKKIRIYRVTGDTNLAATFYPGSAIRSADLNDNFTQNLYTNQDVVSRYLDKQGTVAWEGDMDAGDYQLTNVDKITSTKVQVGTGVPGDNSGTAIGTLITNGSIETQADTGNVFIGRQKSDGAATSTIGYTGSATFNGTVTAQNTIIVNRTGNSQTCFQANKSGVSKAWIDSEGATSFAATNLEIDSTGQLTIKKAASYTDPSFRILDRNNSNADGVLMYGDGTATFAKSITSGGNPSSGATTGAIASFEGYFNASAGSDATLWYGYTTNNGTPTSRIYASGAATFAGVVQSGNDPNPEVEGETPSPGTKLSDWGTVFACNAGTSSVFASYTTGDSDPKILLYGNGEAKFKKYATFGDSTTMPVGGGIKVYRNRTTPNDIARINIGESDVNAVWENNGNFILKYDGDATFVKNIQSGGDPHDGGAPGVKLSPSGFVEATRASNSGTSAVWMGYTEDTTEWTSRIDADGDAEFKGAMSIAGTVTANGYSGNGIITSGTSTSDTEVYSAKYSEAIFLRQDTSELLKSNVSWSANDTHVATTSAIDARIIDLVDKVGGFVAIADEASFPPANPDINDPPGAGTIVSITALSTNRTADGSGVLTTGFATDETTPEQVTITGCGNGQVFAAGYGLLVQTTATEHTYSFVRYVPDTSQIATVAANTADIDTVAEDLELGADSKITIVAESTYKGKVETVGDSTYKGKVETVADSTYKGKVETVADNDSNVTTCAANISNINSAAVNAETAQTAQTAAELAETNAEAARDLAKTYKDLANQSHSDAQSLITQENSTTYNLADNVSSHTDWGDLSASTGVFADEAVTDTLLTMTTGTSTYDYGDLS